MQDRAWLQILKIPVLCIRPSPWNFVRVSDVKCVRNPVSMQLRSVFHQTAPGFGLAQPGQWLRVEARTGERETSSEAAERGVTQLTETQTPSSQSKVLRLKAQTVHCLRESFVIDQLRNLES